jgi:putative flippase GtrA
MGPTSKSRVAALFTNATDNTFVQLFRYLFVGGGAFLVDFGSLYVLTEFAHIHYLVAAALAFLLGLVTNYMLSISWVFSSHKMGNRWLEFAVFALIGLVGLGLNELIIWQCTETLGFHYLVSKMAAAAIVLFWNFFARKFALFRRES